jgi:predicted amidohydrolase YtcJ
VLGPGQRLTPEQGLRLLTLEGARLTFEENRKGTLEPGKLADIAVLTADPTAVPTEEVKSIRAALTVVGGRIVHRDGL